MLVSESSKQEVKVMNGNGTRGWVFSIQKFAVHDGPGIRTTVFLKGCPLRCVWCHNPEGLKMEFDFFFNESLCIGCGCCIRACPEGVHGMFYGMGRTIRRELCKHCGRCTEVCHTGALGPIGKVMSVEEILVDVDKDRPFYENSGGGITISGGEPLMQPTFSLELLKRARERGIHTVLETCGFGRWKDLERMCQYVSLLFFDIKVMDRIKHKELTGVSNDIILRNLKRILHKGTSVTIRIPLVPKLH